MYSINLYMFQMPVFNRIRTVLSKVVTHFSKFMLKWTEFYWLRI